MQTRPVIKARSSYACPEGTFAPDLAAAVTSFTGERVSSCCTTQPNADAASRHTYREFTKPFGDT